MSKPIIFISYSRKNEDEKDKLLDYLRVLEIENSTDLWSDDRIGAGGDWNAEITEALNKANVAILLITTDFLTSKYIREKEVPNILQRRSSEGLTVFPIIARSCPWRMVEWLRQMQIRPKNANAIWGRGSSRPQVEDALTKITEEIAEILRGLSDKPVEPACTESPSIDPVWPDSAARANEVGEQPPQDGTGDKADSNLRESVEYRGQALMQSPKLVGESNLDRRWGKYLIYSFAVLLLVTIGATLAWVYEPAPAHHTNDWEDFFDISRDRQPNRTGWDYPDGQWEIMQVKPGQPGQGALLIKGPGWGVRRNLESKAFYDFTAEFPIYFLKGATKASWVLRAQQDKQTGYIFELERLGNAIYLNAWVAYWDNGYKLEAMGNNPNRIGLEGPFVDCELDANDPSTINIVDSFSVKARVENFDFHYEIRLDSSKPLDDQRRRRPWVGKTVQAVFKDDGQHFRYGNVGLIGVEGGGSVAYESFKMSVK